VIVLNPFSVKTKATSIDVDPLIRHSAVS